MTAFKRVIEVHIGNKIFNANDFEITFDVPFDDNVELSEPKIEIYNLSPTTLNSFKKDEKVILNAGYRDSYGMILSGKISRKETDLKSIDQATTIYVFDSTDRWSGASIAKTYKKNIKASHVITDMAKALNIPLVMQLPNDITYPKGFIAEGKYMDIFKQLATDTGAVAYVNKGKLYVRSGKVGDNSRLILNSDTGLIGHPEPFEEEDKKGYKVKCLLNHRITVASLIQLDSIIVKGNFRVKKGRHVYSGNTYYTEMEVFAV